MTILNRSKLCKKCNKEFFENKSDSHKQWEKREYCCMSCNSSSNNRKTSIFDRLERYQVKNGDIDCWQWKGSKDSKGYGTLSNRKGFGYSPEKAHRISFEKINGEIPDGFEICHKCDNPECTNPLHLFIGTHKENMMDMVSKNRMNVKSLLNLKSYKGDKNGIS